MDEIGIFVLYLLAGIAISILIIGGYAVIWYLLIQRVPYERTRIILPFIVAAIMIVIDPWFDAMLWSSVNFQQFEAMGISFTIIRIIPLQTTIAMAAIVPFLFVGKCIGTRRPWLLIAVPSGIGFFSIMARGFSSLLGPTSTTPDIFHTTFFSSLLMVFPFVEVMVYSAAFYGFAAVFWYVVALPFQRWFRAVLLSIASLIAFFLFEWTALAGLAIVVYVTVKQFRSKIISFAGAFSAGLLLAVIGPEIIKIPGSEHHLTAVLVPMIVIGCAIASAFAFLSEKIRKGLRLPVLFSSAILSLLISYQTLTVILNPTGSLLSWLVTVPGVVLLRQYLIILFAMVFAFTAIIFVVLAFLTGHYLDKSNLLDKICQAGSTPAPGLKDLYTSLRVLMTPRLKLAIFILCGILIISGAYLVFSFITDTTPGRTWTQVTTSAPFGSKGAFASAEYREKLWLIGGTGNSGPYGEAWYTSDGITWNRESSAEMVPQRMGASSAVFKDAIWIIGGITEKTLTPNNDIWYSSNGINWSEIQTASEFSPRSGQGTVVFKDRLWVIGGDLGNRSNNFTSDVWYSSDGISWEQATPAAGFSPRTRLSSFVYKEKIWIIGGWNDIEHPNDVWNSDDGIHWTKVIESAGFPKGLFHAVVFDNRIWVIQNGGIWYSTDGVTWSSVPSTAQFFQHEYSGGIPYALVFDDRLWVFQWHNIDMGIWFTVPG